MFHSDHSILLVHLIQILNQLTVIYCSESVQVKVRTGNNKFKFLLGGLFPVHSQGDEGPLSCGPILREKGIQRLEAMLYALDTINRNSEFWRVSFDATLLDTCSSDSYALEQSLIFLQTDCYSSSLKRVTAVVGAANSPVSESVAGIFRLFKIPQVSYASTSEELDDPHKYPYFFRVVPSDKFQVQVILDILHIFDWSFVSAVASDGDYGEKAIQTLQEATRNLTTYEICFATVEILPRHATDKDYEDAIERLQHHKKARVVVVFLNEDKLRRLLAACKNQNLQNRFLWLGSDSWGAKIHPVLEQENIAEGAITILPKRYPVKGFDKYFLSLRPETNTRNPWFKEYWESHFRCLFNSSEAQRLFKKTCTGEEEYGDSYRQEGLVPKVIDAVYVVAHALRNYCTTKNTYYCTSGRTRSDDPFVNYIANVSFNSSQGHDVLVQFDTTRSIPINYTIYQFRRKGNSGNSYTYVPIGEWNPHTRLVLREKPQWSNLEPYSNCSNPCGPGEERVRLQARLRCCWECRLCQEEYHLPNPKEHCLPCDAGYAPNVNRTSCERLEPDFLGRDMTSPWALLPVLFASVGIFCTFATMAILVIYSKTPVVMASGRELCHLILIGVLLSYVFTFVVAAPPTKVSCCMLRVGLGLSLSLCYAGIFTKTNRVSRIFNRELRTTKRPPYISPKSQVIICLCLSLIQVTLSVLWLIVSPPAVQLLTTMRPRSATLTCGVDATSLLLSLIYNLFLVALCTAYAYKTRNIPENFNETKYISFAMYCSCLVWISFIIIYCSTWSDYKAQSTILCMSISMSGTVILVCLFLPKLYIILFRPHKNVRYPCTMGSSDVNIRYIRPAHATTTLPTPSPIMKSNNRDSFSITATT